MTQIHGSLAVVKIGASAITVHTNSAGVEMSADTHDVTTFGATAHVFKGGLKAGTTTISGIYDSTAVTGPRAILAAAVGTTVSLTWQPEGTGSGKASTVVDAVVGKYVETAPVADMISWSCDLTHAGAPVLTAQT